MNLRRLTNTIYNGLPGTQMLQIIRLDQSYSLSMWLTLVSWMPITINLPSKFLSQKTSPTHLQPMVTIPFQSSPRLQHSARSILPTAGIKMLMQIQQSWVPMMSMPSLLTRQQESSCSSMTRKIWLEHQMFPRCTQLLCMQLFKMQMMSLTVETTISPSRIHVTSQTSSRSLQSTNHHSLTCSTITLMTLGRIIYSQSLVINLLLISVVQSNTMLLLKLPLIPP